MMIAIGTLRASFRDAPLGASPESILTIVVMDSGLVASHPPRNDDGGGDLSAMSFITGVGLTAFGRHEGSSSLDLMSKAAELAIADAGLKRAEIDGILCGYSTVSPHIMLATVFAEHFGIKPTYAHAVQVGGATGLAMTMLAHHLVDAGVARHVLVVGGENRLTGQSRDASILALAQVGHPDYEVPLGPTIPAYYGLVASRYMHEYGVTQEDLAEFAVLMRAHALHPSRRAISRARSRSPT